MDESLFSYESLSSFLVGRHLGVEFLIWQVYVELFMKLPNCFSKATVPFYIPTCSVGGLPLLHLLADWKLWELGGGGRL